MFERIENQKVTIESTWRSGRSNVSECGVQTKTVTQRNACHQSNKMKERATMTTMTDSFDMSCLDADSIPGLSEFVKMAHSKVLCQIKMNVKTAATLRPVVKSSLTEEVRLEKPDSKLVAVDIW